MKTEKCRIKSLHGNIMGYRSSWGVILINHGTQPFMVRSGDRIAQAIAVKVEPIEWNEVESLEESERNTNGFGSTK